jgi:hypothetical protein
MSPQRFLIGFNALLRTNIEKVEPKFYLPTGKDRVEAIIRIRISMYKNILKIKDVIKRYYNKKHINFRFNISDPIILRK